MVQGTEEKYREMLKRTIDSIGAKYLLSINDIGKQNSKVSLEAIFVVMHSFDKGCETANYKSSFGECSRLEDFIEVGIPEYTLNRLIASGYLQIRANNVFRPVDEELLQESINSLTSKYGKAKVAKLKKRLGISEIHYH